MTTALHFNQPVVVHTPGGDLVGLFKDLTDVPGVACVAIYRKLATAEFQAAHKSDTPQVFVSLRDVEAR